MKSRLSVIKIVFIVFAVCVEARLAYWQVVKAADLTRQAIGQRQQVNVIAAPRGEILASDGAPLVTNQERYLLFANPRVSHQISATALSQLAEAIPTSDSGKLLAALAQTQRAWVPLAAGVSAAAKEQITKLQLTGLGFEPNPTRFYPEGSSSAHFLGFVGSDQEGLPIGYFGLEGYYDRQLSGVPGRNIFEADAVNRPIVIGQQDDTPSQPGRNLQTSIDRTIQYSASQHLAAGIQKYGAMSGTVTVMDPATGNILAMTSLPSYDPERYHSFESRLYKNPVVSESYEPGSTFKVMVMAAALDTKVIKPETICSICDQPTVVSNYTIRTWNDKYYPEEDMKAVIAHSDNVGMVFVSRQLGKSRFLETINKFGFGKKTGIDLQDESSPQLRPEREWHDIDFATAAFGQGIAVTPIQMVRAVGALANGGKILTPRVVTQITDSRTTQKLAMAPGVQVVSAIAAGQITQMMVNSVDQGEAKWAKPKGFAIAGKTGTAQIPVAGHYDEAKTIASFVGFAPADHPRFVMLVTLREPQTSQWGSETAAPLWFAIAKDILRYYQIPPSN